LIFDFNGKPANCSDNTSNGCISMSNIYPICLTQLDNYQNTNLHKIR